MGILIHFPVQGRREKPETVNGFVIELGGAAPTVVAVSGFKRVGDKVTTPDGSFVHTIGHTFHLTQVDAYDTIIADLAEMAANATALRKEFVQKRKEIS